MGKSRVYGPCFPLLRLASSFRRCPLSKKSLIIATICVVYLLFVVSQIGYSQQSRDRRTDTDRYRHARGLYHLEVTDILPASASFVVPTRSNVVYITLKSKRLKPANIRGTIRPKLRRKERRNKSSGSASQNKLISSVSDTRQMTRDSAANSSWTETRDVDYTFLNIIHKSHKEGEADSHISSIRIYSQRAPPWFSAQDVRAMRFLADAKVRRIREVSLRELPPLLMFEAETTDPQHSEGSRVCGGQCGVIKRPVDNTEVFAFHLDRVLGLNRTLPAVSRRFSFLHGRSPIRETEFQARLLVCVYSVFHNK